MIYDKNKVKVFGPNKYASQLEGSKNFCKKILNSGNVLTAKHKSFNNSESAINYTKDQSMPIVIKADGLAAGKGVFIIKDKKEAYKLIKDLFTGKIDGIKTSLIINKSPKKNKPVTGSPKPRDLAYKSKTL